jgi:hypothetical protein
MMYIKWDIIDQYVKVNRITYHNAHIGKILLMLIVILLAPNFKEKEKRLVDSLSV